MVDQIIRPADLPNRANPVASEKVPVDNGVSVGGATIQAIVEAGRPAASQAEAEAGTNSVKAMTPLTVDQKIEYEIGRSLASKAQGDKADSAIQEIVEGANTTVDNTDPQRPIISSSGNPSVGFKSDIVVVDGQTDWRVARNYKTVSELLADDGSGEMGMGYAGSGANVIVSTGDIVTAQGGRYEVAASGATDQHVTTAGGVKLYVIMDEETTLEAFGILDTLADCAPEFERVLPLLDGAQIKAKRGAHYVFTSTVDVTFDVDIDWNGASVEFGAAGMNILFWIKQHLGLFRMLNLTDTIIAGQTVGDQTLKNFVSNHVSGLSGEQYVITHTEFRNCAFRSTRIWMTGSGGVDDPNLVPRPVAGYTGPPSTFIFKDNTCKDDEYHNRGASLVYGRGALSLIQDNVFDCVYHEDIFKMGGSVDQKITGNTFRQRATLASQTSGGFLGEVDIYPGINGDDVSGNSFYNVQLHRKQTGGAGPTMDLGFDRLSGNYFELSGDPGGNPLLCAIYYRGSQSVIGENRIKVRMAAAFAGSVRAIYMDKEESVYDWAGFTAPHSVVVSANLIDMRGSGGTELVGVAIANDGDLAVYGTTVSENIVIGADRFGTGAAGILADNQWLSPRNGGTGTMVGIVSVGNKFDYAGPTRGRSTGVNREFQAASSASPSVLATDFVTVTTGGSISNLLDGVAGQEVSIFCRADSATIVNGSGLQLKGLTNATMPGRSVMKLVKLPSNINGGAWQEVSRSF